MRKWSLGPRFAAYLSLNFNLMKGDYTFALLYGILYGALNAQASQRDMIQFLWIFLIFALGPLLSWIPGLLKESISDDSALFYVSIPVSSFETVMAKIIAAAAGVWIPLLVLGFPFLIGFYVSEEKWRIFVTLMWNLGFTRETLLSGLLLIIWSMVILGFAVGGAALLSWLLSKRFCKMRNRFAWVVYISLAAMMLAALAGLLYLIWLIAALPVLVRLLMMMAAAMGVSVVLIRLNIAALEKWYCI